MLPSFSSIRLLLFATAQPSWSLRTSELPAVASPSHYVQARSACELDEAGGLTATWSWRSARRGGPTALLCFLPVLSVLLGFCQSASLLPALSASDETSPVNRAPRTPQQAMRCCGSRLLRPNPLNPDLVCTGVYGLLVSVPIFSIISRSCLGRLSVHLEQHALSRHAGASKVGTTILPAFPHTGSRIGADTPRAVALSGQLPCGHPPYPPSPLPVVWRNAADRLPRRVLISGRDNDLIVIGCWRPLLKELLGCAPGSMLPDRLSIEFVHVWQ